ncbi:SDR family oxidoreductase [Streptomyces sp. NPDC057950]|uniref:SDR family oxidoreductase n=1 Tax=Streptomyces sp. NPDC057950 TaxID=3346288 RepID=UPI0036EACAD2
MRVVVAGTNGPVGSRLVAGLADHGVDVVPLYRQDGSDPATDRGREDMLCGADVVVGGTDTSSAADQAGPHAFRSATAGPLAAARKAGVGHHVVLSVVGAERLPSGRFRARPLLEEQVRRSAIPCSIVRTAPSLERVESVVRAGTPRNGGIRVEPAFMRPVSADDDWLTHQ